MLLVSVIYLKLYLVNIFYLALYLYLLDSSLNNLRQTTSTTVDNNEVDDLLFELEGTNSPNMFHDSELFNQSSLNVRIYKLFYYR